MAGGSGLREIELGRFELVPVLFLWQLDAPNDCSMPGSCRIAIRKLNGPLGSAALDGVRQLSGCET